MMKRMILLAFGAAALAGCQTAQPTGNRMLLQAGFVARKPVGAAQRAALGDLPEKLMLRQTEGGTVSYLYADHSGCRCVYVGNEAALANLRGMRNAMDLSNGVLSGTISNVAPGLGLTNIEDLGSWKPL